ncbi:hypothetical protein CRYUN_Cryun14cG0007700 [Craigia yunnanensis]
MRCKKHLTDLSSSVGVCACCLRERLLALIAAQAQAQSQAQQAQLPPAAAATAEERRKTDPPQLIFPRSVSPYFSRRKSDDNSATWIHHQRFYRTPQVGPTYSTTTTNDFEAARSFKKKNKFSFFSKLFRSRSENFNSDSRVYYHRDSCDEPSSSSTSSWFSAIFAVRQKKQQYSGTSHMEEFGQFDSRDRRSCRIIDRGMSPAVEADSRDECDLSPSGSSPEISPWWKRTPTALRRARTGSRKMSGLAFCLSPLVRASPNRHWNQKGGLPPDMSFTGEGRPTMKPHLATAAGFCANRSRKLADFGRVNHNR